MSRADQNYIIDLCDRVLERKALREYRFDFLLGDPGKNGCGRPLPVDAYYTDLALVIEYHEIQHRRSVAHFDKPDKITVSGVHRGIQRMLYDERRRVMLPKHDINLLELVDLDFPMNGSNRLQRSAVDISIIRDKLGSYIVA